MNNSQTEDLIDMGVQAGAAIKLYIQREIKPLRKRLDQLERRLATLEGAQPRKDE